MTEEWRPVVGFEGFYEVSSLGRVRSLVRQTRAGVRGGKMMSPQVDRRGYASVVLTAIALHRRETRYLHDLVLSAFVGPRPDGMDACHDPDPDRSNCRVDNLRWDTRRGNLADKQHHGTQTRGEGHPVAKLTELQVVEILRQAAAGNRQADIARCFGVTAGQIWLIVHRKQWRHVTLEEAA